MLGFVIGDMICKSYGHQKSLRIGNRPEFSREHPFRGRVSAAIMTIETLLDTPYPQKKFRDLVYGAFIDQQRRLFAEHVVATQHVQDDHLEKSIDYAFISTAAPIGLLAISEEIALHTAPRPKKSHPAYDELCKAIDAIVMTLFYAKVIHYKNAVLENIGYQFGYQVSGELHETHVDESMNDYDRFVTRVLTCIHHAHSLKQALENALLMEEHDPAFFCLVGTIASTLWGVPRDWAYQVSTLVQQHNPAFIHILRRAEARTGRAQVNLTAPKPPLLAPVRRQFDRLFKAF